MLNMRKIRVVLYFSSNFLKLSSFHLKNCDEVVVVLSVSWKILCRPVSKGYVVLLSSSMVRWIESWITNSKLNSFLLAVSNAS